MKIEYINSPFDNFILFYVNNNKITKIEFSSYKIGISIGNPLKYTLDEVFTKKDISLFNYNLLQWDMNNRYYSIYNFLIRSTKKGKTYTYSEISFSVFGDSKFRRFVGIAMKKNPFVLFVPCHRIISKNSLGGYSYGLELKQRILQWESTKKYI